MNNQLFADREKTSDIVEEREFDSAIPAELTDPFQDKNPIDPALIIETPMGGTVASANPLNGPPADVIPLFETPDQEIPMGGTVAPVGPMDEPIPSTSPEVETAAFELDVSNLVPEANPLDQNLSPQFAVPATAKPSLSATMFSEESNLARTEWNEIQNKLTN